MKYIITDKNECVLGGEDILHCDLAIGCKGKVIGAGHYRNRDGVIEVYGKSIGYGIKSKPGDLDFIEKELS